MDARARWVAGAAAGVISAVTLTVTVPPSVGAPAAPATAASGASVVADWHAIAVRTIYTEGLTPVPAGQLYLGFVSGAVYDAVVAVRGGYRPYALHHRPPGWRCASPAAAAVTAAYLVLDEYFPASAVALEADYEASLAEIPDGRRKELGVKVGSAAAAAMIALRAGDGRDAPVVFDREPALGVWRPTPPAFAPMAVPWLGFVRPMLLHSPTQIRPDGPNALTSRQYAADFREVKTMGSAVGSGRSDWQTETALFWNDNAVAQYQTGMREQSEHRRLGIVASARMFAVVNTTTADALIACWRSKYDVAFWRPVTAIQLADSDGNPRTGADPAWAPLVATPPYPENTSGHACASGSVARGLSHLFGARDLDLTVGSAVTGTTRHFQSAYRLNRQTKNARIWLGIHFRDAMIDGNRLGQRVSTWGTEHYFQPVPG